jgi:hypothetical protein
MCSILALYVSYLRTSLLVMLWAGLAFAAYGLIRSSAVVEVIAAASVSAVLSLAAALLVADLVSPSHPARRAAATLVAPLLASLRKTASHTRGKQEI